jgi:membrane-bound lytic murein transglycosylase D
MTSTTMSNIIFFLLLQWALNTNFGFKNATTDNNVVLSPQKTNLQRVEAVPMPTNLSFAGEKVPLDNIDVRERLERELIQNSYKHAATLIVLKREGRWKKLIQEELKANGIPEDFFYLAVAESELDIYAASGVGAHGIWQFMKTTAKEFGLEISNQVDQRRDVILATRAACKYLKQSYGKFGNWTLVAASYNRGMSGMEKAITAQKENSYYDLYLNQETYRYIFRILALKVIIENPESYGFHVPITEKYKPYEVQTVEVAQTIEDLAAFAKEKKTNYKTLKTLNPWLDDHDTYKLVVAKTPYQLWLPASN